MSPEMFERLENKIDKLSEAVSRLIVVEERQLNQGERLGRCEGAVESVRTFAESTDRKVDQWVNRGIGIWALAVTLFAIYQAFK